MKKCFLVFLATLLAQGTAKAECKLMNSVYSSGVFEIRFDTNGDYGMTEFHFKMIDTRTRQEFPGTVTYGNGYSIPGVFIKVPCEAGAKEQSCGYGGTVYTIDGDKTNYGFSNSKPILFPQLGYRLYHYASNHLTDKNHSSFDIPEDIWHFKECVDNPNAKF